MQQLHTRFCHMRQTIAQQQVKWKRMKTAQHIFFFRWQNSLVKQWMVWTRGVITGGIWSSRFVQSWIGLSLTVTDISTTCAVITVLFLNEWASAWVTADVHFVACFSSNCLFCTQIVAYQKFSYMVMLQASSAQL